MSVEANKGRGKVVTVEEMSIVSEPLSSLSSTAAMISYELILSSAVLIIILLTGSFNFTTIIESQQAVWFILPLLPIFVF